MDQILYNGKYFLGAIKFFDSNKDFGYIASNNCGMPLYLPYNQDFYVNSESFSEENAKAEGRVVVFQILKQRKAREKAVNVRRITKSDEDTQLALSYYGEHEEIKINDDQVNLYTLCFKPRKLVAEKVAGIIQNDNNRSPKVTLEHFSFFIKHYKTDFSAKVHYIFDKDFETEEKQLWINFFAIFTDDEWFEILKEYPSACRYTTSESVIKIWIENFDFGNVDDYLPKVQPNRDYNAYNRLHFLDLTLIAKKSGYNAYDRWYFYDFQQKLDKYVDISDLLPISYRDEYRSKLQSFVDKIITKTINWVIEDSDRYKLSILEDSTSSLLHLTSNKHEQEFENARSLIGRKNFVEECHKYINNPSDNKANSVKQVLSLVNETQRAECIEEVKTDIQEFIDKKFDEDKLDAIVDILNAFTFLDTDFKSTILTRLYPILKEKFCSGILNSIENKTGLPEHFISSYHQLTKLYDEDTKKGLRAEIVKLMRNANNIELISNCSSDKNDIWLSTEEAHKLAEPIVAAWKYKDFCDFFIRNYEYNDTTESFSRIEDLRLLIANYAFKIIRPFGLSDNFDGSPMTEIQQKGKFALPENIQFLAHLLKLLPGRTNHPLWTSYVNERSKTDLLSLYDIGLTPTLTLNIIEDVVNEITLDNVLADKERWYSRPILPDSPIKKVLINAGDDLFTAIAHRLSSLPLTDDNISLAVFLAELMKINKPEDINGMDERNWESDFAHRLQAFKASLSDNPKLAVILWAVHFQSSGSIAILPDIFYLLPPYVQIRVVKHLFNTMATGKYKSTAEGLYKTIGGNQHEICFPLEIVFSYLKLREQDPKAELNNNVMLQLLDGREDHGEWIGIRQFVTDCHGRVYTQDNSDNRSTWRHNFYNGAIIRVKNSNVVVYVPNKMIDDRNELQKYNNKYFAAVNEWIPTTFDASEYTKREKTNAVYYIFDESKEMELYTLSRYYRFRYKGINTSISFESKDIEDVFCECRMSDKVDNNHGIPFYWCGNKPCFCAPIRFHLPSEWEAYTLLDFMRILGIPTDSNQYGKSIRFGYYMIISGYLKSFAKFYEHLKCRQCGILMRPRAISNFASRVVNEFACVNPNCSEKGKIVYLNHCFNKPKCNATIDSRDSKTCPNGQYICPECGACCSTKNFSNHLSYLNMTGGIKSSWLINFVKQDLGHWEKNEFFCYKCGKPLVNGRCENCGVSYKVNK